jgi:hypothetical protein
VKTAVDHAERAISDFAILPAVIDDDQGGVEFEALYDGEIDTVLTQIGGALALVPSKPMGSRKPI